MAKNTVEVEPALKPRGGRGLTVSEVARRYRVSEEKVRRWIRAGTLRAINVADSLCGKPRWVVTKEFLNEFERSHAAAEPPRPARRRRKQPLIDYYPD
jgi:excisionase family DNA binding protein